MKSNRTRLLVFGIVMLLVVNACLFNVGRNDDGTLRVETDLSAALIRTTLLATANLAEDTNLNVELMDGYIQITSDELTVQGVTVTDVSFRLDMSAVDGQLNVTVSDLSYSGNTLSDDQVQQYNDQIASALQEAAQSNDVATLDSVSITTDKVVMVWRVDPNINQ